MADALDYLVTLVRLRILDALGGPEPETLADQQRKQDREQVKGIPGNRAVSSYRGRILTRRSLREGSPLTRVRIGWFVDIRTRLLRE